MNAGSDEISSDQELVELAKGDNEAFGKLYERYVGPIYSYLYYRTGNSHDAEDLTEKVFYRAFQHISRYEDKGVPFSAWLYRIARNLLSNWYRDESKRRSISLDGFEQRHGEGGPESVTELEQDKDALLAAIRRLPADRQELLILKFVERMSNAEIGIVLNRSEGAIKSLYHRTLLTLRKEMAQPVREKIEPKPTRKQWISLEDKPPRSKNH